MPASDLLARIKADRQALRKQEPLALLDPGVQPFHAPLGWAWARLAAVSNKIHYGYTASANPSIKDVRLLRITAP